MEKSRKITTNISYTQINLLFFEKKDKKMALAISAGALFVMS
jgi:hypothetical protein